MSASAASRAGRSACRWLVAGRVQGVGFRPFVYRLAQSLGIRGYVRNLSGQVLVVGEGEQPVLAEFGRALLRDAPPLARPSIVSCIGQAAEGWPQFDILPSADSAEADIRPPPDLFCCDDCLRELNDPANRRYRYPFINCTQCGPRYTLIARLPYDRARTSMAGFAMCACCRAEYANPADRRFHAEPIACPECGPRLVFRRPGMPALNDTEAALRACIQEISAGRIVALKGVGGYHLLADATNDVAMHRLRARKQRPHKPFAVMFPLSGGWLDTALEADAAAMDALLDPVRPVVLARLRPDHRLSAAIAPGLAEVGAMLPYSPLHHLLLQDFGKPVVATSANLSGEPVLTEAREVETRLAHVADCFLHHDRDILRPADDSVVRIIAGAARPVRLGRGVAPLELTLPQRLARPLLAVGGQMKNTVALAWDDRAVLSPHLGDMDSPHALAAFEKTIADLLQLYAVTPAAVACDAHPGFAATRWAVSSGMPVVRVQHHHAHASALAAEHPRVSRWIVFAWDGVGLGTDGTLWGGETFVGRPGGWRRAASLRPFALPGGERAAREPWRSAAALCWELGRPWQRDGYALVFEAWRRRVNCPRTSSAGRLFDAAAAILGLLQTASYEGQAPMWLEAAAGDGAAQPVALPLGTGAGGLRVLDWAPLVALLADGAQPVAARAAAFHASLAHGIARIARAVRADTATDDVGLCGGVFQNRLLAGQAVGLLERDGFRVYLPERLPANDGGLAFGQLVEAGARR